MLKVTADNITETVAPEAEPVTLAEAKLNLRVDFDTDDDLINLLIKAAREYCESFTGRSFVLRTYRADLPYFYDQIILPNRPITSITNIKYWDTASPSVLQTLSSDVYTLVNNYLMRNYGESWENTAPRPDAVQITYVAGYSPTSSPEVAGENVPAAVKAAVQLIVGDLYENREGKVVGVVHSVNPTVNMLLQPFRVYL